MNYEILVNKDNPIDVMYMNSIIIPSLVEVSFENKLLYVASTRTQNNLIINKL